MTSAVCVLYHPGGEHRDRLWAHALERWQGFGFNPVVGSSDRGLFAARNVAAELAGEWDVALFADADILLGSRGQAEQALERAAETGKYVCCYDEFCYLSDEGTELVLAGAEPEPDLAYRRLRGLWIGAFAISRGLWDELGGMDERFAGRAGQDVAFLHAASTIAGVERVPGAVWHLWHPLVKGREGAPDLTSRYMAATGKPTTMRKLLAR